MNLGFWGAVDGWKDFQGGMRFGSWLRYSSGVLTLALFRLELRILHADLLYSRLEAWLHGHGTIFVTLAENLTE